MEREEVIERSRKLPAIHPEKIADDHEIWEGNVGDAHFKFTKKYLPQAPFIKFYVLSVSGEKRSREKITSAFESVFGEPVDHPDATPVPGVYFLSWDAGKVEVKLSSEN